MAPRGAKRAAVSLPAGEPESKKVFDFMKQQGVSRSTYGAVVDILDNPLASANEDCRKMLKAVLPWSIVVPSEERTEIQALAVREVGQILEEIEAKLLAAFDSENSAASAADDERSESLKRVAQAEALAEETSRLRSTHLDAMQQASESVKGKELALASAKSEQLSADAAIEPIRAKKIQVEDVLAGSFKKLRDGDWEEGQGTELLKTLIAITNELSLDESLLAALPGSMLKRERTTFDVMVVTQLEESLGSKVAELAEVIDADAGPAAVRTAAVEAVQAELESAKAALSEARDALQRAAVEASKATTGVESAKQDVTSREADLKKATDAAEQKKSDLESFRDYNVYAYTVLRDRHSDKQQPAAEAGA